MAEQNVKTEDIIKKENLVFDRTKLLTDKIFHYCPGCGHGVVHRLLMEVVEELDIQEKIIGIAPVGCSVLAYHYMDIDMHEASHGRAPAVATGIKRTMPDKYVFTYQGDGDLAAIGTAETIHSCNRGENITIIFINNGIYGMTGGQMAPTTLEHMKSSTTPYGRNVKQMGNPLKITELVTQLPGTCFVSRQAVHKPAYVRKTKKAIKKAFEYQKQEIGLSFIEIVSNCNSGWKMSPNDANKWLEENMLPFYPLGDLKSPDNQ
ncbi:MAG: thiamine pyrophosphate-dependent enzyme [Bacteroidota bacterium]